MADNRRDRFTIRTDVPVRLRSNGVVAYVVDAEHPDRESDDGPLSCSWFMSVDDASRICAILNRGAAR